MKDIPSAGVFQDRKNPFISEKLIDTGMNLETQIFYRAFNPQTTNVIYIWSTHS